ncbi:type I-E CRISPR-associated protein Cse1/CasA [Streptomyces sp. DH41]|uniref:type I-E CRISPR-associated protein Cse1/CasA n=1 Tax=Streptomyces sp. DH41 TaxID=3040125 RepID=UPI0024413DD2|nr:type I-E CRISPR-associated protein Cse1/CasA [Streptomyces sp. DH41]MDG9728383.1 type I-E CRISPR-associated protein Cse1/CasA [Streptomyces sp. DH41]
MPIPYLLTTESWLPVWDLDTSTPRTVGLHEALVRAHRLVLSVARSEDVAALRLLVALYDAAAAPREAAEWDAAWRADTLDTGAVTAYLERWNDHFDLFHPAHPALQSAALTEYARGPEALHPGSLGGDSAAWFNPALYGPLPPYPADEAALLLLHLLTYDVAGIKRAAPGDPATKGGKVYGSKLGPVASATHCHLTGRTLKDTLLLNLPPAPRAPGDTPVWERDTPPAVTRTRTPAGRLDLLTWPSRRLRLHATDTGTVDAVAHHDGDRMTDAWQQTSPLDPMTAWSTSKAGQPTPFPFLDLSGWPQPWRAAVLLDSTREHSAVIQHVTAAAQRGALEPDLLVRGVLSTTVHSNRHASSISDIPVASMELGTAGQLADPAAREQLANMARYAGAIGRNLRLHAVTISGRSSAQVAPRMLLADLDTAWSQAVDFHSDAPQDARELWSDAVHEAAERCIDAFPFRPLEAAKLRTVYRTNPDPQPKQRTAKPRTPKPTGSRPAGAGQRGPAVTVYDVLGGSYTLSQLSKHPDCVVSYPTLRKRVDDGWDVTEAATTPGSRGSRGGAQQ